MSQALLYSRVDNYSHSRKSNQHREKQLPLERDPRQCGKVNAQYAVARTTSIAFGFMPFFASDDHDTIAVKFRCV